MKTRTRKTLILLIKLAVAAALLALVIRQIHWEDRAVAAAGGAAVVQPGFRSALLSADPARLAGALAMFVLPLFFLAWRWRYLLGVLGVPVGAWEAVRLTFLGGAEVRSRPSCRAQTFNFSTLPSRRLTKPYIRRGS